MRTLSVTLLQMNSGAKVAENLQRIETHLQQVPDTDLVVLPEVATCRGGKEDYQRSAEALDGPTATAFQQLAKTLNAWILVGSLIERAEEAIHNTSLLLDRSGRQVAAYRKMHLFEAHLEDGQVIRESDFYSPGMEPVLVDLEGWRCGMAICYDLRFPELFRHYAGQGADVLLVPSDFTQRTGVAHWETLLRARAIENQCFVIAPDQCGENQVTGIESYGHSMVVGPWGDVLAEAGSEECLLQVKLDPVEIRKTRSRIPVLNHRRL